MCVTLRSADISFNRLPGRPHPALVVLNYPQPRRAISESQELTRLTELLPYVSCETPVTFGGVELAPGLPLTCTATTAREIAEVIVIWLVASGRGFAQDAAGATVA